jgi:hypothetical protein
MSWLNLVGTIAVGAVVVLAFIAMSDIIFRSPRSRRMTNDESANDAGSSAARASGPARVREFKRSNSTDR